jgi:hypothetical protein
MSATPIALNPADLQPLRRSRCGYSSPDGGSAAIRWEERRPSGRVYLLG